MADDTNAAAAGGTPYLRMWGLVLGAHLLAKGALAAERGIAAGDEAERDFFQDRIAVARFFCQQLLPEATALLPAATAGTELLYALPEDRLAG